MKIILVYDTLNSQTINKICKKYLNWVQNSTFEGDITEANFKKLKSEINKNIDKSDSVIIYENVGYYNKYILGKEKNDLDNFI